MFDEYWEKMSSKDRGFLSKLFVNDFFSKYKQCNVCWKSHKFFNFQTHDNFNWASVAMVLVTFKVILLNNVI